MIAAPPAAVFPWLADSEMRCRWMSRLVESEPLTDGPPGKGSRYRDVFEEYGRRVELEAELVEYDEPNAIGVRLVSDLFEGRISQRLEPDEGGTRLTAVIETSYRKVAARVLASVVTRRAQTQLEADLDHLKELVENDPSAAPA